MKNFRNTRASATLEYAALVAVISGVTVGGVWEYSNQMARHDPSGIAHELLPGDPGGKHRDPSGNSGRNDDTDTASPVPPHGTNPGERPGSSGGNGRGPNVPAPLPPAAPRPDTDQDHAPAEPGAPPETAPAPPLEDDPDPEWDHGPEPDIEDPADTTPDIDLQPVDPLPTAPVPEVPQPAPDVDPADGADNPPASEPDTEEEVGEDDGDFAGVSRPCLILTNGNDHARHDGITTCYNFKQGEDALDAAHAVLDLHVKAAKDAHGRGSLVTGSGDDRIITQQSGRLWTGAGDDDINMVVMNSANAFDIDLGDGSDKIHLNNDHASPAQRIGSLNTGGNGTKDIKAQCKKGGVMDLTLGQAAVATFDGSCAYKMIAQQLASVDATFSGESSLTGELSGRFRIRGEVSPKHNVSGLSVDLTEAREFAWTAAYPSAMDISLRGAGNTGETPVIALNISAPSGRVTLADLPSGGWPAVINMPAGDVHLSAPEPGKAMRFPRLSGTIRSLQLEGCYDVIEIYAGSRRLASRDGCAPGKAMSSSKSATRLVMKTGALVSDIPLGKAGLSISGSIVPLGPKR